MIDSIFLRKVVDTSYRILSGVSRLTEKKYNYLRDVAVWNDYKNKAISCYLKEMMLREKPFFLGRIGGSDFEIANKYYNNNKIYSSNRMYEKDSQVVKHYNGYFDFSNDKAKFIRYLEVLIDSYIDCDCVSYGGKNIIDQFNDSKYLGRYYLFFNKILCNKVAFDYTFMEAVTPFLRSFKEWGNTKKILIVSPFSESITYQFERKNRLIKGFEYPDFELLTYNTNITYNDPSDSKSSISVETENWHEECAKITKEISNLNFDIAFLSCGSYAMPVGSFIKSELNKKAIYVGGILNVLFNIYGKRYDTSFFNGLVNIEYQIVPFENRKIIKIKGGRQADNESLNAYFGTRR